MLISLQRHDACQAGDPTHTQLPPKISLTITSAASPNSTFLYLSCRLGRGFDGSRRLGRLLMSGLDG